MNACATRRGYLASRSPTPISTDASQAGVVVLVAELADNFLGFVAGWIEQTNNLAETAELQPLRLCLRHLRSAAVPLTAERRAVAERDLAAFRRAGVGRLRINSLTVNTSAQASYEHADFIPMRILYEKVIGEGWVP